MACEGGLCEERLFIITTFEISPVRMTVTLSAVVIFVHEPFTTDVTRKLIVPSMVVDIHGQIINCSKLFSTVGFRTKNLYLLFFILKQI